MVKPRLDRTPNVEPEPRLRLAPSSAACLRRIPKKMVLKNGGKHGISGCTYQCV